MFCTSCGRSIENNSKFCIYCGEIQQPFQGGERTPEEPGAGVIREFFPPEITGRIVLQDRNDSTKIYACEATDSGIMGRETASCCMVIEDDKSVSRRHCRFTCHLDGWYVEDMGSYNHTILNGREVRSAEKLRNGDLLKLGAVELVVEECKAGEKRSAVPPKAPREWFCTRCGSSNQEKNRFCTKCGAERQ